MLRNSLRRFSQSSTTIPHPGPIIMDGHAVASVVQLRIQAELEASYRRHISHLDHCGKSQSPIREQQQQQQLRAGGGSMPMMMGQQSSSGGSTSTTSQSLMVHDSNFANYGLDLPPGAECPLCVDYNLAGSSHHQSRRRPCLATICVGEDSKQTAVYVRNKHRAALAAGFASRVVNLPETVTQEELEEIVESLNADTAVHGILIQRPLPERLNAVAANAVMSPVKDVDGLHPSNVGLLYSRGSNPVHVPCTALAVMRILDFYNIPIRHQRAAIVGTSNIVGRPVAEMLLRNGATVTTLDSFADEVSEEHMRDVCRRCDIIVSACGEKELIRGSWVKPGAAVVDVGITPVEDPKMPNGYKLFGDCCFSEVKQVAGAVTPVPRGVGPVTVAMLLQNTLLAYHLLIRGHTANLTRDVLQATREAEWMRKDVQLPLFDCQYL